MKTILGLFFVGIASAYAAETLENSPFKACKDYYHAHNTPACVHENHVGDGVLTPDLGKVLAEAAANPGDKNLPAEIHALEATRPSSGEDDRVSDEILAEFTQQLSVEFKEQAKWQAYQADMTIACLQNPGGTLQNKNGVKYVNPDSFAAFSKSGQCKKLLDTAIKGVQANFPKMRASNLIMHAMDGNLPSHCVMDLVHNQQTIYALSNCQVAQALQDPSAEKSQFYGIPDGPTYTLKEDTLATPTKNAACSISHPDKRNQTEVKQVWSGVQPTPADCNKSIVMNQLAGYINGWKKVADPNPLQSTGGNTWEHIAGDMKTAAKDDYYSAIAQGGSVMAYLKSATDPTKDTGAKANWVQALQSVRNNADDIAAWKMTPNKLANYKSLMEAIVGKDPRFCGAAQTLLKMKQRSDNTMQDLAVVGGVAFGGGCLLGGFFSAGAVTEGCVLIGAALGVGSAALSISEFSDQGTQTFSKAFSGAFHNDMKSELASLEGAQNNMETNVALLPLALPITGGAASEVGAEARALQEGRTAETLARTTATTADTTAHDAEAGIDALNLRVATADEVNQMHHDMPLLFGYLDKSVPPEKLQEIEKGIQELRRRGMNPEEIQQKLMVCKAE